MTAATGKTKTTETAEMAEAAKETNNMGATEEMKSETLAQELFDLKDSSFTIKDQYRFEELLKIMRFLRSPQGCPWDRKQTHTSLRSNLIEEAWECLDALDSGIPERFADELGDLLLQVVFHAQMSAEAGEFTIDDVIGHICRKLVSRHTHLFGKDHADSPEEVLATWEKNKMKEKGLQSESDALKDVPSSLPALARAAKVQKKAANCGFDWPDISGADAKIDEELAEFRDELSHRAAGEDEHCEEEAGDLLFAVVNTLRKAKIDPEIALQKSNEKFIRRFERMEAKALDAGQPLRDLKLDEMEAFYQEVKKDEKDASR